METPDQLKVIKVENHDRQRVIITLCILQYFGGILDQAVSVITAGELVFHCHFVQGVFLLTYMVQQPFIGNEIIHPRRQFFFHGRFGDIVIHTSAK